MGQDNRHEEISYLYNNLDDEECIRIFGKASLAGLLDGMPDEKLYFEDKEEGACMKEAFIGEFWEAGNRINTDLTLVDVIEINRRSR